MVVLPIRNETPYFHLQEEREDPRVHGFTTTGTRFHRYTNTRIHGYTNTRFHQAPHPHHRRQRRRRRIHRLRLHLDFALQTARNAGRGGKSAGMHPGRDSQRCDDAGNGRLRSVPHPEIRPTVQPHPHRIADYQIPRKRQGCRTMSHGADAYLSKPFDKEELLIRLKNLTALSQRLRERLSDAADGGAHTTNWSSAKRLFKRTSDEIVKPT